MAEQQKQLVPGLKINQAVRRGSMIGGGLLATISIASFVAFGLMDGLRQIAFIQLIWLFPAAFQIVVGARCTNVVVLADGLEVNGRFVPFAAITKIESKYTLRLTVTYLYHGAEFKTSLVANWFSKIDLTRLAAELGTAAGLDRVEHATTVQPS
jgi:hypothetical protein